MPALVGETLVLVVLLAAVAAWVHRGIALAGALGFAAALVAVVETARRLRAPVRPVAVMRPVHDAGLRPFARLTRLRTRVDWGSESADRFMTAVAPLLTELADDRLRRRGVDRRAHPDAARALLGPELSAILAGRRPDRVPTTGELADHVARIEEL